MNKRYNLFKRQFLIHKESQLSVTFYFLVIHFVVIILLYLFLRFSTITALEEYYRINSISTENEILSSLLINNLNTIFILFAIITTPIFFYSSIVLTNRIVGPLTRYHKILKSLNNGEDVTIHSARKDDFFKDFYQDLNDYIKKKN